MDVAPHFLLDDSSAVRVGQTRYDDDLAACPVGDRQPDSGLDPPVPDATRRDYRTRYSDTGGAGMRAVQLAFS